MSEETHSVSLPVVWVGVDELPVHSANQFFGQVHDGEIYLTVGVVTPPLLPADEAEAFARLTEMTYVPVRPIVRLALTKPRLDEVIGVLQEVQQMYEAPRGEGGA